MQSLVTQIKNINSKIVSSFAWTIGPQRSEDRMALYIFSNKGKRNIKGQTYGFPLKVKP